MAEERVAPAGWGRWGTEDERGALNFIDPAKTVSAAQLVTTGRVYPLALPIRRNGPMAGPNTRNAPLHLMRLDGGDFQQKDPMKVCNADDYVVLATHGSTHLDALCHVWRGDRLYNGFSMREVRSTGAWKLGIEKVGAIVSRGVLIDVARNQGVEHLAPGTVITEQHLEDALDERGLTLERGDVVLIRTGWLGAFKGLGSVFNENPPGIGMAAAGWLVDKEIAVVGTDTPSVEVVPSEDGSIVPVHILMLHENGVYLLELAMLDSLADDMVNQFLFVGAPLMILGGTAGPLTPVAIA